jgi:hypothetical protein
MKDRRFTEQEFGTRMGQIRAGIEKLEYEAKAKEAADGTSSARAMTLMRSRLTKAELELERLQHGDTDVWDEARENLQSILDTLANDIDRTAPSFGDT